MDHDDEVRALSWRHGVLTVNALGAMLGPGAFLLPDGRQVSPLHVPPWWNEAGREALDPLTRGLRGEWPCVPFGFPVPPASFTPNWQAAMDPDETGGYAHGYGSHHPWRFRSPPGAAAVEMEIDYPEDDDVARLERTIRPDPDAAAVELELRVHARRACRVPIALHGCFAVPAGGGLRLEPGPFAKGLTYPGTVEPGASLFARDAGFERLDRVPGRDGGVHDASHLPLAHQVEELLQLNGCAGSFGIASERDRYRVRFTWDAAVLPSVLLWYSNYGRAGPPWLKRHLCIGVEPSCSAFGMSPATSAADNPMARGGTPTAVALTPGAPLTIAYRIAVEPLDG